MHFLFFIVIIQISRFNVSWNSFAKLYFQIILASGMPFRVYAPEHHIPDTDYSLEVGKNVLQMYEVMFDLPFPLPKSGKILHSFCLFTSASTFQYQAIHVFVYLHLFLR